MRLLASVAVLAATLAIAATGIAPVSAQSTAAVPVSFLFADAGTDKIASDGLGIYENGKGVSAVIDPSRNGELILYSVKSGKIPARRFMLTFDNGPLGNCIAGPCGVPPWTMPTGAQFIAGVRQPDGTRLTGGLLAMPVGAPGYRAGLKVYLGSIDNVQWTLCLTPGDAPNICSNSTSTGSTPTRIVRTATDKWTISADAADPRSDVGELFSETSTRRSTTIANQGKYAMPFSMTICASTANCQ